MAKRLLVSLVALLFTMGATSCGVSSDNAMIVGFQKIPNSTILLKASKEMELLGHEVEWLEFASGAEINAAFASGAIDVGVLGSSPFAIGLSNGLDYKAVLVHDILGTTEALVSKSGGSKGVENLVGQVVATPFGSTAHFSLLKAIELAGLRSSDFTLVDMQPGDILAAWVGGSIDNAYVWDPVLFELRSQGGVEITNSLVLADAGFPTSNLGVVSGKTVTENPKFVKDWVHANLRANAVLTRDPNAASVSIAEEFSVDAALIMQQLKGLSQPEADSQLVGEKFAVQDGVAASLNFLVEQGFLEFEPSEEEFESYFVSDFVRSLEQ